MLDFLNTIDPRSQFLNQLLQSNPNNPITQNLMQNLAPKYGSEASSMSPDSFEGNQIKQQEQQQKQNLGQYKQFLYNVSGGPQIPEQNSMNSLSNTIQSLGGWNGILNKLNGGGYNA